MSIDTVTKEHIADCVGAVVVLCGSHQTVFSVHAKTFERGDQPLSQAASKALLCRPIIYVTLLFLLALRNVPRFLSAAATAQRLHTIQLLHPLGTMRCIQLTSYYRLLVPFARSALHPALALYSSSSFPPAHPYRLQRLLSTYLQS